jgi:hypothetical protein
MALLTKLLTDAVAKAEDNRTCAQLRRAAETHLDGKPIGGETCQLTNGSKPDPCRSE